MTPREVERFFLDRAPVVLDGGLATELEDAGHDLDDPLWSARVLLDDPGAIRRVHARYFEAGADVATTATYQASFPALSRCGLGDGAIRGLFRRAAELARAAAPSSRCLVAGSLGSFGACRADGSEFRGDYDVGRAELRSFHRPRIEAQLGAGVDIVAFETFPRSDEAEVVAELLAEWPEARAWISFSTRDGERLSDGTPVEDALTFLEGRPQVVAVGVNCTAPRNVTPWLTRAGAATGKPRLVYPNSGEAWRDGAWTGEREASDWGDAALAWRRLGAAAAGGCCRTTPEHIRQIKSAFIKSS